MASPLVAHLREAKRVLRYLKGTINLGIRYKAGTSRVLDLKVYVDASYASDLVTAKSTTGWIFTINGGPVSWALKRQSVVA